MLRFDPQRLQSLRPCYVNVNKKLCRTEERLFFILCLKLESIPLLSFEFENLSELVEEQGVKSMQKPMRTLVSLAVVTMLANTAAHAGGFSLYTEASGAAIGNYAAGIAAEGADASIGWYNPAGLVLIHQQQAVFSGVGVFPSSKLTGTSTFVTTTGEPPQVLPAYTQRFSGLQGGKNAFVPSFHYALPLGDRATFGFSVVSPFGLSTEYDQNSPVRYAATYSELLTVNVSPELGAKLTDNFSVGAGLDLQWAQVKFNRMLGAPTLLQYSRVYPFSYDSLSYNKGHSLGVGFHAGVMTMFNDNHTRVGLNYQSSVEHKFHGYSQLSGRLADPDLMDMATVRSNSLSSNNIKLPKIVTLSGYQDINNKLALLGSVVYSGWNSFKTIQLNNVAAFSASTPSPQILVNSTSAQNFRNAWRVALGANYHVNEQWMMRVGGGYDQTPTVNAERDVRLPDANRWALSVGTHYQMRPNIGFDLGYTYLFASKDPIVNKTDLFGTTSTYNVNARADVHAHLVGLQAVWIIDQDQYTTK